MRGGVPTLITETCRIAWWKGYVKGRFVALVESEAHPPHLIAESSPIRSRGSDPPEPTEGAVLALDALAERLVSAGWTPGEVSTNAWFGLVFSRPATAIVVADEPEQEVESSEPDHEHRELPAVTRLRSELLSALDEVDRQQRLRVEAEERAKRVATNGTPAAATDPPAGAETAAAVAPQLASELRAVAIALEMTSVVAAALIFLLVFGSIYASLVAGLTTGAVVLGLDSLFAVRSRRELSAAPGR